MKKPDHKISIKELLRRVVALEATVKSQGDKIFKLETKGQPE